MLIVTLVENMSYKFQSFKMLCQNYEIATTLKLQLKNCDKYEILSRTHDILHQNYIIVTKNYDITC